MLAKYFLLIFCAFTILGISFSVLAQDEEVDHIALARLLVKDGHYQRAERTLKQASREEIKENEALVHSFWGMIFLHNKKYEEALKNFDKALTLGLKEKEIHLYRAESYLQLGQLSQALTVLEKIDSEDKNKLPYFLIKAEAAWRQGSKLQAFAILQSAEDKKLSQKIIEKKKFSYLIEEKLFLSATEKAFFLLNLEDSFQDVLAMASQLRLAGEHQASLEVLQALQVLRPEKEMVALEMAQNYLALSENFSAALILENAAKHNISLNFEASEMLRQVGKSYRARFLNLSTTDPAKQLKQKLALYLEEDDYLSLKFMIPQLQKNQMLEDQEIRYAVAYSLFRTGDFERSESFLNSIDKDGLFEKSIELKREITNCQEEKWACSEVL